MDITSILLGSYINAVSGKIYDGMTEEIGLQVQALIVEHHGIKVGYQYQMWRIKIPSVCDNRKNNVLEFSQCTQAAKSLFEDACHYLQDHPENHWKHRNLQNMYCDAAISFKPTIATMSVSESESSPLDNAKRECSLQTVAALGSTDKKSLEKRDSACSAYRLLKAGKK